MAYSDAELEQTLQAQFGETFIDRHHGLLIRLHVPAE